MDALPSVHSNYRLRQERIRRNWRQQDVADQLGTTVVSVRRWELGSHQPSLYFREKLCALFDKSAEELGVVEANLPLPTTPEKGASGERLALWMVPYRRNRYFTGRDALLQLLDQHLSGAIQGDLTTTGRVALTQPQALKGLGGIGKTQIAVEYAYRVRERGQYTYTLWINATSQEAMMTSFTALADVLPEFPAKNETNHQKLVAAVKRWLEHCPERWFLIVDNADDLSWVQEYLPQQGNGSILLTTRANAVGSLAASIEVETMGFVEGTRLLLSRAQRLTQASDEEVNEAGNIVVTLDHFPLALEQAGAYIEETGCSLENYLHLYQTHRRALLARRGTQTTNYPNAVATTWSLSFHQVEQANPAAAELLRLCAFLAPDHIPEELLTDGAPHWPPLLQKAAADPFAFDQMLETLLAFSLVKRLAENHLLSIHRLVQVVQMERMDSDEQRRWAERVVFAVNAVFPRDPSTEIDTWALCLRYLEQAQTCNTLIQELTLALTEGADLLNRTGAYLYEQGSYAIAEPLYQRALCIWEQSLGSEHPQVASSLKGLADLYNMQGKYSEAEPLYQRALCIWEQSLGSEHLQVASSLNNLANLYYKQGKYMEAEPLYLQTLRVREQSLGSEHPQVAYPLTNLAMLYKDQGKYTEAESLYQRALRIREQSLGPEHPQVAYPLTNLGELYREQGKYTEAEPVYQRALCIWEQCLGPEHPLVAYPLNGLANLYSVQGKYTEAESLYQRVLRIWEQSLSPEHPDIADPLHGFAALWEVQGKSEKAASLYQHALTIREKVYGRQHPKTTDTRERLHALLQAMDKTEDVGSS